MNELEQELLKTLSFIEPMTLEFILLDLDKLYLEHNPTLTTEDLIKTLTQLQKKRKVRFKKYQGQGFWIKIYPKRPWYKNILSYFSWPRRS